LHNDRGVIAEERGDFVAALAAYREALGLRQQLDVPDLVAESLGNVAFASLQLGQFDNALVYWQQALVLYRKLDSVDRTLRIELSIGLLDIARGHYAEARTRLQTSLHDAEDRQLPEEASIGHINFAELALVEGRLADALEHAGAALQIATRRTDLRTATEAALLQGRATCELGDTEGMDAALSRLPVTIDNGEQVASRLLVESCRARLAGDLSAAIAHLDSAARLAAEVHSGRLGTEIRLHQLQLALASGESSSISRQLQILTSESAQLREFPQQLEWLTLQMATALRASDKAEAARRYRDALGMLKGIEHSGIAFMLHSLGSMAVGTNGSEALAAQNAARDAQARLLADAPEAARPLLKQWQERRLREETGVERAH
jgi:tetratricopeptide (TPR) repeat protein